MSPSTIEPPIVASGSFSSVERRLKRLAHALGVGFAGFVIVGAIAAIAAENRQALWAVAQTCAADARTTGYAFPCLLVDSSRGETLGYAVLRPPVGRPDTILTPMRRSIGLEDPWLRSPEAPNYFLDAWNIRTLAPNGGRAASRMAAMGVAVNSRYTRRQDQLHIHIGCLTLDRQAVFRRLADASPSREWVYTKDLLPQQPVWSYRTGASDLAKIRPFRIAADKFGEGEDGVASVSLFAVPVASGLGYEFLLLAFPTHKPRYRLDISSEDVLDARCEDFAN